MLTQENLDPAQWELTQLVTNTGPVTTSVGRLQDRKNHKLWIYFGAGRYFFREDDKLLGRTIIGLKDHCYKASDDLTVPVGDVCRSAVDFSSGTGFVNQTGTPVTTVGDKGWYITLEGEDLSNKTYAERSITDPVAMTNGAVFFTTYKPSADMCKFGGNSYLWGMKYDTGGSAPASALKGKALVQVSTGSFEEVDLGTKLTDKDGRKMGTPMVGKPPNDPPPIVSPAFNKPLKRVIHMQEK
jgi:type IV pilus assembly protein PilY1